MAKYTLPDSDMVQLLQQVESWVVAGQPIGTKHWARLVKRFPKPNGDVLAKDEVIKAYRRLAGTSGLQPFNKKVVSSLQMKPRRTQSGVTPVTVLTKPFPCPGKCIFCPNDIRMPKSYLSDEPGAQRAERNYFDPYLQTYNRLQAFHNIGHPIQKVEIIVLGGTWSYYPESYQVWFIKECFRALNEFGKSDDRQQVRAHYLAAQRKLAEAKAHAPSDQPQLNQAQLQSHQIDGAELTKTYNQVISQAYVAPERTAGLDAYQTATWEQLETQHQLNESADQRCVGLVIETRPDNISETEVVRIRRLGCTKTQIGFQSLQDSVLGANNRGHDVAATRRAVKLLRQAGFKIHAHWMANLHGSSVELDKADYKQLFNDPDFKPDELKIYPCSLIQSAELMQYYQRGDWQPYTHDELLEVLTYALQNTPEYCRLTRVIRDIPSTDIVAGNKQTNFRQIAEQELSKAGAASKDIRAREIKNLPFEPAAIQLSEVTYETSIGLEIFLQFLVPVQQQASQQQEKILGFLRLSLPKKPSFIQELGSAAIIREAHVYGQALGIGQTSAGKPQHLGLGKKLIQRATEIASQRGYTQLSVISAVGTRDYYRQRGFEDGQLYQHLTLAK